jgi:outer membrane protein OmpA-like peptidoglycan-associated protein
MEPEPKVIVEAEKEDIPPPAAKGDNPYNFTFSVVSATTLKEVPGNVTLIDAARSKTMKSVSTNQAHALNPPNSQSKEIIALCEIFGYQKAQVKFKIDDPMSSEDNSFFSQSRETTTIKFELFRQSVGDVLTMYNVYFYNNSAIMKPESKFELNGLLGMIKENENLEIRIHGHTNGNASGKLITLKEGDLNFFEVTSNNDEKVGSAKELSKERANAIRMWLIEQGVDENRMSLKGWGGKKMLYKKNDKKASKNVRVEIEILKG